MEKAHHISWKAFKILFATGLMLAIWLLIDPSYKLAFCAAVNTIAFLLNWAILIITGLNQKL